MPRKKKAEPPEAVATQPEKSAVAEEVVVEPEHGQAAHTASLTQVVTFGLGDQLYAVPIENVQEIQQIVEFTPVPDSSPALVGILDVRGLVVPAIDLRLLLGMPPREYRLDTPMILLHSRGQLVAVIVDEVQDVFEVPEGSVQAPSGIYALADKMIGVCRSDSTLVIVLDPDRLVPQALLASANEGAEGRPGDERE